MRSRFRDTLRRPSLLADHDVSSLASLVASATGCKVERAERAATKALHHAFGRDHLGDVPWGDAALRDAGIGRWARPVLAGLSPRIGLDVVERARSEDGAVRLLLRAGDGALVESVIIPAEAGRDRARTTVCISSQVGCARRCTFCETGALGLQRQLAAGEIVDQYRIARRMCEPGAVDRPADRRSARDEAGAGGGCVADRDDGVAGEPPLSNVVFMGMGEPLDNLEETARAISLLTTQQAFAFAPSRITVSTAGVADKLDAFFRSTRAELAISLNATDDQQRNEIMPINRRFDLKTLRSSLLASLPPGRRLLFQYTLFDGFNDTLDDADRLANYIDEIPCRVNLIAANRGPNAKLVSPAATHIDDFAARLQHRGVTALVRQPRGRDVGGACGQLAGARRRVRA